VFQQYSYFVIFGLPVIAYLGIATLIAFFFTASIAILNFHGIRTIPFQWHPRIAALAIVLAIVHGTLGLLVYVQ